MRKRRPVMCGLLEAGAGLRLYRNETSNWAESSGSNGVGVKIGLNRGRPAV